MAVARAPTTIVASELAPEEPPVKKFGITTTAVAAIAALIVLAAGGPAGASSAKRVAFAAKYAGTATTQANDTLVSISATGAGTGAPIGKGTLTGKGTADSSQRPCVPFLGTGQMTGTSNTKVTFKLVNDAKGCGDENGESFSLVGHVSVVKATGKLIGAKGTLKFTGNYDRSAGTFSVKFTGTLTTR
jgi:hypothetical protein